MHRKSYSSYNLSSPSLESPPEAESTKLVDEEKTVASPAKFPWGGKFTPKRKATSPLQNSKTIFKTNANSMNILKKIDPHIYTDTQSRGLASRVARYAEKAENTPGSLKSVYNRPGDFPIVNLRKTAPGRPNATPPSRSMTIAPPDKSVYQKKARYTVLRNGEITKYNEPLAPTSEHEVLPTKSVIDALTEISRKRINNEELGVGGHIKKTCSEPPLLNLNATKDAPDSPVSIMKKRQWNCSTASLACLESGRESKRDFNRATTITPTRNNELYSSLSSSILINRKSSQDMGTVGGLRGQLLNMRSSVDSTRHTINPVHIKPTTKESISMPSLIEPRNEKLPLVTPSLSALNPAPVRISSNATATVTSQPKMKLFNVNYGTSAEKIPKKVIEDEDDLGINFVKPKESFITENPMSGNEKIFENRLKMMFSCIRADEDDEDCSVLKSKDDVDTAKEKPVVNPDVPPVINTLPVVSVPEVSSTTFNHTVPVSTTVPSSTTSTKPSFTSSDAIIPKSSSGFEFKAVTSKPTSSVINFLSGNTTKPVVSSSAIVASSTVTSTISSDLKPPTIISPAVSNVAVPSVQSSPTMTVTPAKPTIPATSAAVPSSPALNFTFGGASIPTSTSVSSTPVKPTVNINFGAIATPTSTESKPDFSFGTNPSSAMTPKVTTTLPVMTPVISKTTTATTFTLGNNSKTAVSAFGSPHTAPINFSNNKNMTTVAATTAAASSNISTHVFGSQTTTSSSATPAFGSSVRAPAPVTSSFASPSFATPAFGAAKTATAPSFGTAAPAFGAAPAPTSAPSTFGQNTFGAMTTSTSTFGTTQEAPTFGTSQMTSAPTFGSATPSFGMATPTTSASTFGAAAQTSAVTFGSSQATPTFGATLQATSSAPVFGINSAPVPSFGSTPTFASSTAAAAPTFGATPNFGSAAPPSSSSNPPGFGSNTGFSGFGASPGSASSSNVFGAPSTTAPSTTSNVFGTTSAPAAVNVFGGSNTGAQTNVFGSATAQPVLNRFGGASGPTASTNLFTGAMKTETQSAPSAFSFKSATSQQPAPDSSSGMFKFGGAASVTAAPTFGSSHMAAPTGNDFGSPSQQKPAAANIFGGSNSSAPQNQGFGGFSDMKSSQQPSQNGSIFGGINPAPVANPPQQQQQQSTFSFGGASANNAPAFGSGMSTGFGGASAMTSAPAFGAPTATDNTKSPFSFGASTATAQNQPPQSSAFSFGGQQQQQPQQQTASFAFGGQQQQQQPNAFEAAAAPANPFNFSGATTATATPGRRPIRTAARRLK